MSLRVIKTIETGKSEVTALSWTDKGLFCGDLNGIIYIFKRDESQDGGSCKIKDSQSFSHHQLAVSSICNIGDYVFSSSLDGTICKHNIDTNASQNVAESVNDCFTMIAVEHMNMVIFGTTSGSIYFYNVNDDSVSEPIKLFQESICSFSLHPTENKVVVLTNKEFLLFNLDTKEEEKRIGITADCCTDVSFADNALSCVVSTTEGTARVVDMISMKEVGCVVIDDTELNKVQSIQYGKRFIMIGCNGKVCLFNLNQMIKEPGLQVARAPVLALAVNTKLNKIAVSGFGSSIALIDFD